MNSKPNFIFFGTPDVASETLEILKQNEFIPSLIVTSPDARAGRKMLLTPPAVKIWAEENKIPYIQPEKLNTEEFKNTFDLFIVFAYGKIIPENILNMPKFIEGKIKPIPQNGSLASVCKKIKKEDGLIDLNDDAVKNYNKFQAYAHWPRTFFFQNDKRIIITDAELQNGKFVIKKILPEGKKEVAFEEFNLRHGVY